MHSRGVSVGEAGSTAYYKSVNMWVSVVGEAAKTSSVSGAEVRKKLQGLQTPPQWMRSQTELYSEEIRTEQVKTDPAGACRAGVFKGSRIETPVLGPLQICPDLE